MRISKTSLEGVNLPSGLESLTFGDFVSGGRVQFRDARYTYGGDPRRTGRSRARKRGIEKSKKDCKDAGKEETINFRNHSSNGKK